MPPVLPATIVRLLQVIRKLIPVLLAGLIGVAAAGVVACGEEKRGELLSPTEAQQLIDDLDRIQARFDSDDCEGAKSALTAAEVDANSLSAKVDDTLKERINDGLKRLRSLLDDQCEAITTTTDTTPTITETTTTTTTPTETTDTTTTGTTDTGTTIEPEPPPDDGSGGVEPPPAGGGVEGGG